MPSEEAQIRAAITRYVEQAYPVLDQVDYYQMLNVSSAASAEEIKAAYYRLAARLHPDVHGEQVDEGFRARLTAVYSRVVEAYKVLSHHQRRGDYDAALARGDMRLQAVGTRMRRPSQAQEGIKDAKARRFYELAQTALAELKPSAAVMNLRMALTLEPDNELIKALLAKAEKGGSG